MYADLLAASLNKLKINITQAYNHSFNELHIICAADKLSLYKPGIIVRKLSLNVEKCKKKTTSSLA
jgi:hypothetical protein